MIAVASHANREQKERIRHTELRNREDTIKRELHINFWSSIRESRGTSIVTRASSLHLLTNLFENGGPRKIHLLPEKSFRCLLAKATW